MTSTAAELSFAAELIAMLVALAGLVLVVRSREMGGRSLTARALLGTGLVVLAVVSFLHGSTIVESSSDIGLVAGRLAACALIVGGSVAARPPWPVGLWRRVFLGAGVVVIAASAVADATHASASIGSVLLGVGALAIGVPVAAAGRQSIATRVAIASAGMLLLVLVVLSVAMSQVISSSVEASELAQMAERATTQGYAATDQVSEVVKDSRREALDLEGYFETAMPNPLNVLTDPTQTNSGAQGDAQGAVQSRLNATNGVYPVSGGGFAYVLPGGSLVLASEGLLANAQAIARLPSVLQTFCPDPAGVGRLVVTAGRAFAVGAVAECSGSRSVLGTLLAITPLDSAYLRTQRRSNPAIGLALVSGGQLLASSGLADPDPTDTVGSAARAMATGTSSAHTVDGHFVAVQPIAASGSAGLQVVATSSESALVDTRDQLFRTLFLVALGSTVVALALAALLGERITSGLRRLTEVVGLVQASNPVGALPRAGSRGADEVGVLGRAFDTMIDEVEARSAELQASADDETRLRNRLEAVVAGISDSLVAVDVNGRVIEFNEAAERLFGVPARDALGTDVREVVVAAGDDPARLGERVGRPVPTGWEVETDIRGVGGLSVPVTVAAGATRGPAGELIGSVLVLRDLRGERELERMKTEFLSRVGHELRTPLTGIMGYADILLRRDVDPARARQWYAEILGSARRLLRIVEMLEFFASSGAGTVRLRPEPLDPRSLVSGIAARWSATAGPAHPIVRRIDPDVGRILADRRWLVMALDELLDNAAKFSPAGGRIALYAGPAGDGALDDVLADVVGVTSPANGLADGRLADGRLPAASARAWVEIAVVDHGEGMSADEQARAFGEFVQADASDTRRFGGLGLGLALVKRVVEGHGGTVVCLSVAGRGSAFVLRLPAVAAEDG